MAEEYATIKQLEFMNKLGFPPQSADLTKQRARELIAGKLEERDKGNGPVDVPVEKVFAKMASKEKPNGVKEYHLSPEEVKCRALESAIEMVKPWDMKYTQDELMQIADKFVEWIYK